MPKIYIKVDTGVVTGVVSDSKDMEIILADHDNYVESDPDSEEAREYENTVKEIDKGIADGTLYNVF